MNVNVSVSAESSESTSESHRDVNDNDNEASKSLAGSEQLASSLELLAETLRQSSIVVEEFQPEAQFTLYSKM